MDLTQHPPEPAATSAKRLRRAPTATATSNNNRPSRGILKHSPSWLDTEEAENRSFNVSCRTKNLSTLSSFSQYFDRQVAQDIVNSYKRPATIATHEEQMETCRLMIYDLIQFSTLLLDEKHDASLAVEGYTLALTVVHLQTKLHDNLGIIRFPPEELLTEMITYKLNTAKLLQRMHEARGKYGTYDRALDEAYRTMYSSTSTYSHTRHSDCTTEPLHIKSYVDYMADTAESITSAILYNMSVAYSLQNLNSLALQTCQLALECTRFVPNAHRGMLIKTLVLRRIHNLLVGRASCEKDIIGKDAAQQRHQVGQIAFASGLDPTQISEELFTYEVYMLAIYPSGAMAA